MCQLTPLRLSKDSIVLAFYDFLFVKTNCRITVAFTYLLKRGTSWNELELPETSWNHLEKAAVTWNELQPLKTGYN